MKAILVLDDDAAARVAVVDALRDAGFDALAAGVDVPPLEVISRAPELLGLILLDGAARKPSGPEFLEILRHTFPCLPIVRMSALAKTQGKADGVIGKPVRLDVLLSVAHEFCA